MSVATLQVNLHPGQARVYASAKRFPIMLGGPQSGKTSMEPIWLLREIKDTAKAGELNDYLVVEATYDLFKLKMLPEFLDFFVRQLAIGRYWAEDKLIELAEDLVPGKFKAKRGTDAMWGRIILRSADSKAGLESATVKAAVMDEFGLPEYNRQTWEAVQRRLSLNMGRCLIATTLYTAGWKDTEIQALVKTGDGEIISVSSADNPAFPKEEYERQRAKLPGWKFNMMYRGIISKPVGLVYSCFDKALDVVDRRPIPKEWPVYVGHDFGTANPAALFYAQDPGSGILYLFAEYKPGSGYSTADNVREWKEITMGYRVVARVGGSHQEEEIREAYRMHDWPIQEPPPTGINRKAGILHAFGLHREHKIKVFRDMDNYQDEISTFAYKLSDKNEPEEIENEPTFHLMAAERYVGSIIRVDTVVNTKPHPAVCYH